MIPAFYTVDNTPYYNVYMAWNKARETGKPVEFYLDEANYDQHDWTVEPTESFDELMANHAWRLRNKYQKLLLLYSGGYDSHTIYDMLARHRVHIDVIICFTSNTIPWFPSYAYEYLKQNHWDPGTEIVNFDANDVSEFNHTDEHWLLRNQGTFPRYHGVLWDPVNRWIGDNFGGYRCGCIIGMEKPRLVYKNGQWHSRQMASVVDPILNHEFYEAFYLEPKIAIKQSHIFKNNVKQWLKSKNMPLYEGDWAEAKFGKNEIDNHYFNLCSGRIPELVSGASFLQKANSEKQNGISAINTSGNWQNIDTSSPTSTRLIEDINAGKSNAKNFLKAVYEVYSQTSLMKYFQQNNLFVKERQSMLYDLPYVWSKEYCIGS
jgi:hypothetical protein